MKSKLITAALLLPVLLAGCQTQAARDACLPPGTAPFETPAYYTWPLFFYLVGCKTTKALDSAIDEHGLSVTGLSGRAINDQYQSADGIFSVSLPGPLASIGVAGYHINEQYLPHDDYVYFATRDFMQPVYGIKVTPQLDREYAGLDIDEYADLSMRDARMQAQRYNGTPLQLISHQMLKLDGKQTLFRVYRQAVSNTLLPGDPRQIYYLVYFIKQDDRAAIISVLWPKKCPQCETGDEQGIRDMDPGLQRFVSSFAMGSNG